MTDRDRRPRAEAPLYGVGYLGVALVTQVVMMWVTYYYAPPDGRGLTVYLPIGLVGMALILGRIVDAVADPLVAVWSDNTTSPRGRRIPFILYGSLPLVVSFALIWFPPVAGPGTANFIYLALMLSLFLLFFTIVVAPYLALLPELAAGRHQRVKYSAWQAFFNIIGLIVAMVGAAVLIESLGFRAMGVILGLVALASFLVPATLIKERPRDRSDSPLSIRDAIALSLANRPFRFHLASQFLFWFGFNMVMIIIPYVVTVIMGLDEGAVGLLLGGAMVVALLSFPLVTRLAGRWGTRKAFLSTSLVLVAVLAALSGVGLGPAAISTFWQGALVVAAAGIPLAGLFILPNAITAEVTDHDFTLTGRRREAIYYGMGGLAVKASMGLSSVATTAIMGGFGFSPAQPLGIRLAALAAAALVFLGFLAFLPFPLGRPAAEESASG